MARTWILTGSPDNHAATREHGFSVIGFKDRNRNRALAIEPGDRIVLYATGVMAFAGSIRVEGEMYEDHGVIWARPPGPPRPPRSLGPPGQPDRPPRSLGPPGRPDRPPRSLGPPGRPDRPPRSLGTPGQPDRPPRQQDRPDPYPWRFPTSPEFVIDEDEWVPVRSFVDQLDHIQKWPRAHWTLAFQGQIRPVSDHDATVLVDRLSAASAVSA